MAILEETRLDPESLEDMKIIHRSKSKERISTHTCNQPVKWLTKKGDAIMVMAILIATMAFQAGVTPPSGVWQDDNLKPGSDGILIHKAGEAVIAYNFPKSFKTFMSVNAIASFSSLSTMLLLISGLYFRQRLFMWMLVGLPRILFYLTITTKKA